MKIYGSRRFVVLLMVVLAVLGFLAAESRAAPRAEDWLGKWVLIENESSNLDLYGTVSLDFRSVEAGKVLLVETWGEGRSHAETLDLALGGAVNEVPIAAKVFASNVFMGLRREIGGMRRIRAGWEKEFQVLALQENVPIQSSQGKRDLKSRSTISLDDTGTIMTWTISRPTRPSDQPLSFRLKKEGYRDSFYMELADDWKIESLLPEQAALITLQGVVNREAPLLYFIYPETWDFRFTDEILDFYKEKKQFTFTKIASLRRALAAFEGKVHKYVVWDPEVRTSLIVAFTVAGLEDAIVVTEDLIPLVEEFGLKQVEDFRGRFTGMNDFEIYTWAYNAYWDRCNKDAIVWMGGEHGNRMKPGVADFGMYHRCFFTDLSTDAKDPAEADEYKLADKLFSEMNEMGMCFGWHSYKKDKERDHVKLASSHLIRVSGLHTLPNMSFNTQVPLSPGFEFKNNHNVKDGVRYVPEKKVYIAAVQTDALGIGAWTRPGRGEIPYAWQVTPNWLWMGPSILEMFYDQGTPNDLFIGGLSGPGYMYSKAIPRDKLPMALRKSREYMETLDLSVFEIMDYSEGASVEGNPDLPQSVVDVYFEEMPDAVGFLNGYAPAYTFVHQDGRAMLSYDYYMAPGRPEAEVRADLLELAAINEVRPYFLLLHVRQWSDISRVKAIFDSLGPAFEVVSLDVFLKMAAEDPTFENYTRPEDWMPEE
ncbi:GxGYxYP family putative glycoside hydrolase [Pelagicoccus sp. SDUM812002]|nr:GxGYxYP family putative glycoside hydrolase [Pelagicoccus sp. SDUM812002]